MDCICMYTPEALGGHALYSWEVLTALASHPRNRFRFELITSQDLMERYDSNLYAIHKILPPLRDRRTFSSKLTWGASRIVHYSRRERHLVNFLKGRPDIIAVHLQMWTPWLAARLIRDIRAMGKRVFYTCHNVFPHKYPNHIPRRVVHGWIRRACAQCDGIFVHTDALAQELSRFLGEPHPPIQVVPHGVWTVDSTGAPPLHQRLAWKKLLFFGSIRRNKGLDLLLRAAERLPGYTITVAGEPMDRQYFEGEIVPEIRRLRDLGINIDLHPFFLPDEAVGPLLAEHSAMVLPYTSEFVAQSGVVFTALAYQMPVIASEAGGLSDLFQQFNIGAMFNEPTPRALADAVRSLFSGHRADDVAQQLQAARKRFSWQDAADATLTGYRNGLDGVLLDHDDQLAVQTISAR